MGDPGESLTNSPRCVLAAAGRRWPVAAAAPFWSDGAGIWVSGVPIAELASALRADPRCAVTVLPVEGGTEAVSITGTARVYGAHDPPGLLAHGPAIATALTALALKHAPTLVDYARDIPRLPRGQLPEGLVVARVLLDHVETVPAPVTDGMGPSLPSIVPAEIRRGLAGRRDVLLAVADPEPRILVASWTTGLALSPSPPDGTRATAVVDGDRVGMILHGTIADSHLVPEHARWWRGLAVEDARVPARPPGGIALPD